MPYSIRRPSVRSMMILILVSVVLAGCSRQPGSVSYSRQIQPIFDQRCATCHGAESHRGKIVLATYESFARSRAVSGGGALAFAGRPEESRLLIVCASKQSKSRMTPDSSGHPALTTVELGLVYRWIAQGARNNSWSRSRA